MKNVTVIFREFSFDCEPRAVEFEADNYTLLGQETENPAYVITKGTVEPVSNIFIDFDSVLAIGWSEDMESMIRMIERMIDKNEREREDTKNALNALK